MRIDGEEECLALHRDLVSIKSLSGEEDEASEFLTDMFERNGITAFNIEKNVVAQVGTGPELLFVSHMDTVPPGDAWTRDPWDVSRVDGRVYGLGSNDAKASVAAMIGTLRRVQEDKIPCRLTVLIAVQEETGGRGAEIAWPELKRRGLSPLGVVVGEPTGLDIAIAQKGLLILELQAKGEGGHSAHAAKLKARNAIREIARDLIRLETLDLGEIDPWLGPNTCEPTLLSGGEAKNKIAEKALCTLDLRTVPGLDHEELIQRVSDAVNSSVRVVSNRLESTSCKKDARVVIAARRARENASLYGSPTMSDMVYFRNRDAIKCGPGLSERSHQPDEFVLETEIVEGLMFYTRLCKEFGEMASRRDHHVTTLG